MKHQIKGSFHTRSSSSIELLPNSTCRDVSASPVQPCALWNFPNSTCRDAFADDSIIDVFADKFSFAKQTCVSCQFPVHWCHSLMFVLVCLAAILIQPS